jgi:glucuronate isomerase
MSSLIHDDFLLQTDFAKVLYHQYAKDLPVIDYHCHLSPASIANNEQFSTITNAWLQGDHYKWRAMRTLGIQETYITGNASDSEKFSKWAYTVPYAIRNPLYHWTHLELKRYFDIGQLLTPESSERIYQQCNERLSQENYKTRGLLKKMKAEVICTTDDPIDQLNYHSKIKGQSIGIDVLPAFRPDKAYAIENQAAYLDYLNQLEEASSISISSFSDLIRALSQRIEFFHKNGCRLSDHGLEQLYYPEKDQPLNIETIFQKVVNGKVLLLQEIQYFKYTLLLELCRLYHAKSWTQQFHLGALRNTNSRMLTKLGPDTGFDSIGDFKQSTGLSKFLNELDKTDQLGRTIIYNLNPGDNEIMATMIGNFNDGSIKGKIQFGSAWWFLDQKDGMEKQLNALSNLGLLSCFIGMLTDSRSFLSFPRHEYFRRILCNLIGNDVAKGELPQDEKWLGKIVADISYHNAKAYFNFAPSNKLTFANA